MDIIFYKGHNFYKGSYLRQSGYHFWPAVSIRTAKVTSIFITLPAYGSTINDDKKSSFVSHRLRFQCSYTRRSMGRHWLTSLASVPKCHQHIVCGPRRNIGSRSPLLPRQLRRSASVRSQSAGQAHGTIYRMPWRSQKTWSHLSRD